MKFDTLNALGYFFAVSTAELKAIVEKLALSQAETVASQAETGRQMKETDRKIKELGKQIGGLGNKFGTFAEGLSYHSIRRILEEEFFWLPEHTNKTFHGMVAYVSGDVDLKRQIIENGWYLAHVGDEIFEMEIPERFTPRAYTSE